MAKNIGLITVFLIGFLAIVIGVNLLTATADTTSTLTSSQTATNESFTGINDTAVALSNTNIIAVSEIRNATHDEMTLTTDYTVNTTAGTITVLTGNGTYYADYTYFHGNYIEQDAARNMTALIIIMFAVAVLAVTIGIFLPTIREI